MNMREDSDTRRLRHCPNCGRQIRWEARFCDQCGQSLAAPSKARKVMSDRFSIRPQKPPVQSVSQTNPLFATILALGPGFFGLMGLGHIYVRSVSKGLMLLVVGAVLGLFTWGLIIDILFSPGYLIGGDLGIEGFVVAAMLFGSIFFSLWLWQAYDAYSIAKAAQQSSEGALPPPYY